MSELTLFNRHLALTNQIVMHNAVLTHEVLFAALQVRSHNLEQKEHLYEE